MLVHTALMLLISAFDLILMVQNGIWNLYWLLHDRFLRMKGNLEEVGLPLAASIRIRGEFQQFLNPDWIHLDGTLRLSLCSNGHQPLIIHFIEQLFSEFRSDGCQNTPEEMSFWEFAFFRLYSVKISHQLFVCG